MPEASVLYVVTAVVIAALVVWVAVVLRSAKEPWARPAPPRELPPDVAVEPVAPSAAAPAIDADETAKATPVALGEARAAAAAAASANGAETKSDAPPAKA